MTECIFYDQSYVRQFEARVRSCVERNGLFHVVLDRTAFYPTSGGQPFDVGSIDGLAVSDVYVDAAHEVWHVLPSPLPEGQQIEGRIDWARRFDHMQQHAADHMIAGCLWKLHQGHTVGLHLGEAFSTIDVIMPQGQTQLDSDQIQAIEHMVNEDIQRDLPIRCFFPKDEEFAALPLRKPPSVEENIRVVLIGDEECVACGGTHPSSTGQIGLVKILWTAPSRGKLRLAFVSGMRAFSDYQARFCAGESACALLSSTPERLPESVAALLDRQRALEAELMAHRREGAKRLAAQLLEGAGPIVGGWKLVCHSASDMDMNTLKELAKALIEQPKMCALLSADQLGATGQPMGVQLLFARAAGDGPDMGALMKRTTQQFSGKGGGRPEFAQGAAADIEALSYAERLISERTQAQ